MAGFASSRAVTPAEIDDGFVAQFISELEALGEVADAKAHDRRLRRQWNRLKAAFPEFELKELKIEAQARARWTVCESEFNPVLAQDIETYLAWLAQYDPLAENPGRGLQATTVKTTRHQLVKTTTALAQSGRALETMTSLGDFASVVNVKAAMTVLYRRQGSKTTHALHRLGLSLVYLARDWVRSDPDTISEIRKFVGGFSPRKRDDTGSRTRKRLQPFEDERLLSQLLTLPIRLLDEAKAAKQPRKKAMLAQARSPVSC